MGGNRRPIGGFSLVEAMVAAGIFAAVIISMGHLVVSFLDAMRQADEHALIMTRAEDYISRCFVIPFGGSGDVAATNEEAGFIFDNDLEGMYAGATLHSILARTNGEFAFNTVEDPTGGDPFAYLVAGNWKICVNHDIDGDGTREATALEQSDTILRIEVYFLDFNDTEPLLAGVRYGD